MGKTVNKGKKSFCARYFAVIIAILSAVVIGAVVLVVYWCNWGSPFLSNKQEDWDFFSGYLNNLLSPSLLFISMIFSVYTFAKQLRDSNSAKRNHFIHDRMAVAEDRIDNLLTETVYIIDNLHAGKCAQCQMVDAFSISDAEFSSRQKTIQKDKDGIVPFSPGERIRTLFSNLLVIYRLNKDLASDGGESLIHPFEESKYNGIIEQLANPKNWPNRFIRLSPERIAELKLLISDPAILQKLNCHLDALNTLPKGPHS